MARGRSGRRSDYEWFGARVSLTGVTSGSSIQAIVSVNAAGTIMRIRGRLAAVISAVSAPAITEVTMGLIIATDDAVAVGATAIPDPELDSDAEWMWHGTLIVRSNSATLAETGGDGTDRLVVDTKAMRKVKTNSQLVLVINGNQTVAGATVAIVGFLRLLIAL